jgi:hypothetical protein
MRNETSLKFQSFPLLKVILLGFIWLLHCPLLWAAQSAVVLAKKAVIYSDIKMSSPLGFVKRGKKISVGNATRNKGKVYPIIVSGKIAFIRAQDISTERESVKSHRLSRERFQKTKEVVLPLRLTASYFRFASQILIERDNGGIEDKEALAWNGISLKAEYGLKRPWGMEFIMNFMVTSPGSEMFRALELGMGVSYLIFQEEKWQFRLEGQFLGIPYSSYAYEDDFRVNGYGFTLGSALNVLYKKSKRWSIEGQLGLYYTQLRSFEVPKPYQSISPSFFGTRLSLGANYSF